MLHGGDPGYLEDTMDGSMSLVVQMIWGERREHGTTMGAVQRLPMELPDVATFSF
jgi:hypothetical protein